MAPTRTITPGKLRKLALFDAVVRPLMYAAPKPPPPPPAHTFPGRILVIELWGIGDVILATPMLATLRERFPEARITLLAKPVAEVLLAGSGLVDEVIGFDFPWTRFSGKLDPSRWSARALARVVRDLRARRFDLSLDARRDARSNIVAYLSGATRRIGYDFGGGSYLLTDVVPAGDQQGHRSDDWLQLLRPLLGETPDAGPPLLRVTSAERDWARATLGTLALSPDRPMVAIDPGASHRVRRLSPELVTALATGLAADELASVVLLLPPDHPADAVPALPGMAVLRPSLRELMALIASVDLLVCGDSAPMHMAAALGTPTTSVFGSQPRQWFAPRGKMHRAVQVDPMPCRPCFDACIYASPLCIDSITPAMIRDAVDSQLNALPMRRPAAGFTQPAASRG